MPSPYNSEGNRRVVAFNQHFEREKRNRRFTLAAVVLIIFAITLLLLISIWQRRPVPRFMFLTEEWLIDEIETEALIIRDETVYNAPVAGIFTSEVAQGSKVARGARLGQIVPAGDMDQVRKLDKANSDISDRRYELLAEGKGGDARRVFEASEEAIRRNLHVTYDYLLDMDYYKLAEVEMDLRLIMDQRIEDAESYNFQDEELNRLISLRDGLQDSAFDSIRTINSEAPGTFIRQVDGLERELTPEFASTITIKELAQYLSQVKPVGPVTEVKEGDPLYKLNRSPNQYFVALLPLEYQSAMADFQSGSRLRIYSSSNGVTVKDAELIRQESSAQGNLVVFRSKQNVEAFASMRKAPLSLFVNEALGLRVPKTSLIGYQEGNVEAKLKIIDGGYVKETTVKITATNDQYALVESPEGAELKVRVSTMILLNPDSMKEGEALGDTQN